MNLPKWLSVILMLGLILALNPLGAWAEPYHRFGHHPGYHHPRGNAYGWRGPKHYRHFRHQWKGPHHYYVRHGGPPSVAYVAPVAPIVGIPYAQPQPYCPQPAPPGLSGQFNIPFNVPF